MEWGKRYLFMVIKHLTTSLEILKQPVHTSVAIDMKDFEDVFVEDNLHVAISVKDFKAVISHAETVNATVTARYTRPCRPLQLAYEFDGVSSEFTLMTRGEADSDEPPSSRMNGPELSARQTPAPVQLSRRAPPTAPRAEMPPPPSRVPRALTGTSSRAAETSSGSQRPPATIDFDSLFVPADDDRQWDETHDDDEPQDTLGWDATADQVCH